MINTLWFKTTKNRNVDTGPFTCQFICLLATLTHSLALYCSLCSHDLLYSFLRSLAHSLARGMIICHQAVLHHSASTVERATLRLFKLKSLNLNRFWNFSNSFSALLDFPPVSFNSFSKCLLRAYLTSPLTLCLSVRPFLSTFLVV